MSTIVTRTGKGRTLTHAEVDANFTNLNTDKLEAAAIANMLETSDIGVSVQAHSANLDEYAAVNPTAAGLALLDDADAAAQRTTLGLVIGTDVQAYTATGTASEITTGTETAIRTWAPDVLNDAIRTLAVPQSVISYTGTGGVTAKGAMLGPLSAVIPLDSSVPQNTEGSACLDVTITPSKAGAVIDVESVIYVYGTVSHHFYAAIFKDTDAAAVSVGLGATTSAGGHASAIVVKHRHTAVDTTPITFKVRFSGSSGASYYANLAGNAQTLGGTIASYIKATEVGYT